MEHHGRPSTTIFKSRFACRIAAERLTFTGGGDAQLTECLDTRGQL